MKIYFIAAKMCGSGVARIHASIMPARINPAIRG